MQRKPGFRFIFSYLSVDCIFAVVSGCGRVNSGQPRRRRQAAITGFSEEQQQQQQKSTYHLTREHLEHCNPRHGSLWSRRGSGPLTPPGHGDGEHYYRVPQHLFPQGATDHIPTSSGGPVLLWGGPSLELLCSSQSSTGSLLCYCWSCCPRAQIPACPQPSYCC